MLSLKKLRKQPRMQIQDAVATGRRTPTRRNGKLSGGLAGGEGKKRPERAVLNNSFP
jgi:hypothetical protein